MRPSIVKACVLAILSCGVWAQQTAAQQTTTGKTKKAHSTTLHQRKKKGGKEPSPAVTPTPAPPPPVAAQILPPVPATLMNSAPVKPDVSMENGLLTIDAPNSTLSDVLSSVQQATGATIEGALPTERVAVRLGPGDPRQVLAALLEGTPYNFVILGSLANADAVTRIVLSQPSDNASAPNAMSAGPQPAAMRSPANQGPTPPSADDAAGAQPAGEFEGEQQQPPPQPPPQQPQPPQTDQNRPKTPEELFRELQPQPQPQVNGNP